MSRLAFSASFEYLIYGCKAVIIFHFFSVGIDFWRQNLTILTSKDNALAERVTSFTTAHNYYPALIILLSHIKTVAGGAIFGWLAEIAHLTMLWACFIPVVC